MIPTEHPANAASTSKTGLFATLRGPFSAKGSGASSRRLILSVLATTLGALAFTTAPALAAPPTPSVVVGEVTATEATLDGVLSPKATPPVEDGTYEFLYKGSETEGEGGTKR